MFCLNDQNFPNSDPIRIIDDKYLTVQAAGKLTGYKHQYLRRLLREGKLAGIRVGQVWLIQLESLKAYLERVEEQVDRRCGPKSDPASTNVNTPRLHAYTPE